MGMGGGFGQSQGNTGIGASPTTTGQSQSMGQQYGGKGGGTGTPPRLQQPSQSSTTKFQPPQKYQPTGPNIFGYNMNRLSALMDPSATLPGDNTQQTQDQSQYQAQDTFQPQYQPQDTFQNPFGGKGGGSGYNPYGSYDPYGGYGYQPQFFQQQYQPQYQQQPQQQAEAKSTANSDQFAALQAQLDKLVNQQQAGAKPADGSDQIAALQERLDKLISQQQAGAKPAADSELTDTGEVISKFDPGREATGVGSQAFVPGNATLSNEDIQKGQQASADAAAAAAAKIDPATGKEKYQYSTYKNFTTDQLSGLNKSQIDSLYKASATTASKDIAQAKKDVKNAKTPEQMKAANAALETANKQAAQIKTDQKTTQTQMGKAKVYSAPVAATPAPAPTTSAPAPAPAPAPAASAPRPAPAPAPAPAPRASPASIFQPAAAAPAPAPASIFTGSKSSKKAKGGAIIVHKGMTSKLKKQLKNK